MTLSAFSDELANVRTKKKEFLAQIDHIIPWGEWIALIRPCYYKGERGNKPYDLERIMTFDSKGELLITIMSSLAQEESRSISENVTWGQRKRFSDGKVSIPYGQFLGYRKGA
ncbi:MAG: hypothetical protein ACI3VJ_00740, partial [Hominicoprocola sp.]